MACMLLPGLASHCMQVQQKVERLVAIWEERKVFGQSGAKPFTELVDAAGTPKKAQGTLPAPTTPLISAKVPGSAGVNQPLQSLLRAHEGLHAL